MRNRLGLLDDAALSSAEQELSAIAANEIDFEPPPYQLAQLKRIHRRLFQDVYEWAGELRSVDIAKGGTRFCNVHRIEPEAEKLFAKWERAGWFETLGRVDLVRSISEAFGDLNIIHPFREGNGRAQRILFEHMIINAGHQISWWAVDEPEWIQANIDAVVCDYRALASVFERCIGPRIE